MTARRLAALAAIAAIAAAACGSSGGARARPPRTPATVAVGSLRRATGPAPWPAPEHAVERSKAAGLEQYPAERLEYHVHGHLDVFVDGERTPVPAAIGIGDASIAPLHTHDASGVVHIEAPREARFTLGQFLTEWGVRADGRCLGGYCPPGKPITVYVDGKPYTGDLREIDLVDRREIAIVIGTPPAKIPDRFGGT
ncbi:MAG: hypothetical protein U0V73_06415 [Acidimicrobiia bacterium]